MIVHPNNITLHCTDSLTVTGAVRADKVMGYGLRALYSSIATDHNYTRKKHYFSGVDLEPDFLGVSRTSKLEYVGVRQKIWESAIFRKYNIIYSWVKLKPLSSHSSKSVLCRGPCWGADSRVTETERSSPGLNLHKSVCKYLGDSRTHSQVATRNPSRFLGVSDSRTPV